jgi:cyclase
VIKRIISRLDIKNNFLVKGINLEGLRVLGSPESFAEKYYNENIDELILQDVVASLYKRNQLNDITKKISQNIFIPITVGGGIRSIEDISKALDSGADRVSINSAAVENLKFVEKAIKKFGSSTISLSIETLEVDSQYKIYTESGRKETNIDFFDWIKIAEEYQLGELIVTSIKSEGRSKGLDLDLYKKISDVSSIPILAHGGASSEKDILNLFTETIVQGVVICSAFHFYYFNKILEGNEFLQQGSTNFLNNLKNYQKYKTSISDLKQYLKINNINVR